MDRRGEEKGKESDARPPISQGFVIKGGGVAFSVSVTLKVNKTNGTLAKNLHWAKPPLSEICVCAPATHLKKKKRKSKERKMEGGTPRCGRCTAAPGATLPAVSWRQHYKASGGGQEVVLVGDNQDVPPDRTSAASGVWASGFISPKPCQSCM